MDGKVKLMQAAERMIEGIFQHTSGALTCHFHRVVIRARGV